MDELDWINSFKKVLKVFCIVFSIISMFFLIISFTALKSQGWEYSKPFFLIAFILFIAPIVILCGSFMILKLILKIINPGKKIIEYNKGYIRDLPKHCSPAIASFVYDLKIDVYKDYTATVLYLCIKKYIKLEKEGNKYKLKLGNQSDTYKLGRCEKYVLDIISNKDIFDATKFKQEIIKESQERDLITNKKESKKIMLISLSIFIIILLIITYNISKIIFLSLSIILGIILYIICVVFKSDIDILDTQYIRTEDGKKLHNCLLD